jgi:hypothetical protein
VRRASFLLLAAAVLASTAARAVEIAYFAQNEADPAPGHDRWTYHYQLDEFPYDAGYGFTVYFDPDLYSDLDPSPHAPGEWDPLTVEPDAGLGDEGFYDAEAIFDLPRTSVVFTVSFRWLGAGSPGAQPFEVREPEPSFAVIEDGTTVLPEPTAVTAGLGAIAALASLRRMQS